MADLRISELSALAGSNLAGADELAIVDDSASETKKISVVDLIANGVTVISDDTIPGAKILFSSGDITTAALADAAVTTTKVADGAITAAKLADESTVDLVASLPASGAFVGQLALDTDDNNLYAWGGSTWLSIAAPGSVANINGSTTGEINIVATTSGTSVTISATIDDTTSAAQFLAGPTGSAGAVGYRTIVGTDLPVATTSAKGGVIVNGNGLVMDGDTIEIDNTITSSATHHVVTYDANGLITGGRVITSADLPFATETTVGAVSVGDGLTVGAAGELSIDNSVIAGTYTKVTVTAEGLVSSVDNLGAADIPDHSAAKLTSGTIGTSLIANDAVTADKIADQSTTKFGGAAGSDNVTIFPTGDFQGQFFYDETTQDLYIYTGSSFVPITVLSGNLVNAGAYNASTNQMSSVTSAGSSAGFSVGAALPAPAQTNLNHYVVVDTSGTGTGAAPAVALAPPDMLLSQGVGTEYSLIDVSNAIAGQTASNISLIATGNIVATDVQAGIQELDSEKLQKAGDTMTGALGIGTASSIVFEGSTADDYETTLTVTDPTSDHTITFPDVTGNVVTTGDTGTVTSTMILDGTIVNADINASAEIAVSKLADGAARQLLQTDAAGTGVEWASNIDIPGTLDVTGAATLDSTVTVTGLISANGKVSFPAGTAAAPGLYPGSNTDTGIYSPGSGQLAISTNGTGRFFVDASGNVGVGASPDSLLDIKGDTPVFYIEDTAAYGSNGSQIIFRGKDSGGTARNMVNVTGVGSGSNSGKLVVQTRDNGSLSDRVVITSDGLVGVGTSSPTNVRLDIKEPVSSTAGTGHLGFSAGSTPLWVWRLSDSAADLYLDRYASGWVTTPPLTIKRDTGNVGIGTTSPNSKLTLSTGDKIFVPTGEALNFGHTDGSTNTERMRIDSSGNLLYGMTNSDLSATHNLMTAGGFAVQYAGTTGTYLSVIPGSAGGEVVLKADARSGAYPPMTFATGGSEKMRLDSSGRLLVGTSSTQADTYLVVEGQSGAATGPGTITLARGSSTPGDGNGIGQIFFTDTDHTTSQVAPKSAASILCQRDGGTWTSGSSMPARLVFSTTADGASSPTERLRIASDGTSFFQGVQNVIGAMSQSSAGTSVRLYYGSHSSSGISGTVSYTVWSNGNVVNTNDSYGAISDIKLKENIVDASSQWDDFKAVRFRKYNFKEETGHETFTQLGVIAQELEQVCPGLVDETPDRDEEGNDLGTTTKSVKYSILTKKALVALQEAMERIEILEAEVAALKAQ